jgi:soluble lytic murein transglycosylase-like protein
MAFCFISLTAAVTVPARAADAGSTRVSSTVRADKRTGRLVRSTVVTAKPPAVRTAAPPPVESKAVEAKAEQPAAPATGNSRSDINGIIEETSQQHAVDPLLVHSVIRAESNYNPYAVSPKGAEGIMQLIPATARRFGASNSFDVRENITAGVKYLKYLRDLFQDDRLAVAAYNAGEGAVLKYGNVPPYKETEQYVNRVGKSYGDARKKQQASAPAVAAAPLPPSQPVAEPLRQLDIATDAEGRIILRSR